MSRSFTPEQKAKLTTIVNQGIATMQEIEDLNGSLNDTIKAFAEEMEIKPAVLKKAIRIAAKSQYTQNKTDQEALEEILTTVGRTV